MKIIRLRALLAPFNVANSYNEVFSPTILTDFVREAEAIPMKLQHGYSFVGHEPVGTWTDFEVRPDGLYARGNVIYAPLVALLELPAMREDCPFKEISVSWFQTRGAIGHCESISRPYGGRHDTPLVLQKPIGLLEASLVNRAAFPGAKWEFIETIEI